MAKDDEVPLRNLSPNNQNRLPPGKKMSKAVGRGPHGKGVQRRISKNIIVNQDSANEEDTKGRHKTKNTDDFPSETLKRIDYVILYEIKSVSEVTDKDDKVKLVKKEELREKYLNAVREEGIEIQEEAIGDHIYLKLHVPFKRLCFEAERMKLEMPLEGCQLYPSDSACKCWTDWEDAHLVTDNEVDFVSAPFFMSKLPCYVDSKIPDKFFRPSTRSFLAHHILINMDIRDKKNKEREDDPMARKGLPYMLHKKVFSDAFILHDETVDDPAEKREMEELQAKFGSKVDIENPDVLEDNAALVLPDTRRELDDTWCRARVFYKYQPLWKIRNYFGEKIALYFAWSGTLISTLWLPCLFGLCCFFYGLYISATDEEASNTSAVNDTTTAGPLDKVKQVAEDSLNVIKKSFDNDITPYFALVICLWGTIFLEVWKRKNATLAYEWDVDSFEDTESDRPQFIGTHNKPDPIVPGEDTWYYPLYRQFMKFFMSFSMLIVMVLLVFVAVASVILYRVIMTVDYCGEWSPVTCLLVSTLGSSLLNAAAILLLGKIYDKVAVILTDWENHRTQTQYDDALIIKLFAFQFVNSYTSLFYIAFFRGDIGTNGIFGLGEQYQDSCGDDNNCMSMLSFQVLVLMLAKPLPKFLKDIILPWVIRFLKRKCCCCKKQNKVLVDGEPVKMNEYLAREQHKPQLGDFTLGEYTEKVIVYGFLMLFAASFPLAPLIAILIYMIDMRIDGKRMLWMYRRPVSHIAQDIGMWYGILQFINVIGVISNACLIAFTSSWGANYPDLKDKLLIVLGFEHICFAVKFIIEVLIPDEPATVKLAKKREKYQVQRILEEASQDPKKSLKEIRAQSSKGNQRVPTIEEEGPRHRKTEQEPDGASVNEFETDENRRKKHSKSRKHKEKSYSSYAPENRSVRYDVPEEAVYDEEMPRLSRRSKKSLPPLPQRRSGLTPRSPRTPRSQYARFDSGHSDDADSNDY